MKVNIGNYRSWYTCQIHYDYMNRKYDHKWDESNTKFERFLERFEDLVQSFYNLTINQIYDKIPRKTHIHIDQWDVYSADHTLAMIIHPVLVKLKEQNHGYFMVKDEDVPDDLKHPKDYDMCIGHEIDERRYEYVMDEMIWTFDAIVKDCMESEFFEYENIEPDKNGNFIERLGLKCVKRDIEGMKAYDKRIRNGLRLFGKYYLALWD